MHLNILEGSLEGTVEGKERERERGARGFKRGKRPYNERPAKRRNMRGPWAEGI